MNESCSTGMNSNFNMTSSVCSKKVNPFLDLPKGHIDEEKQTEGRKSLAAPALKELPT